MRYSYIYFEPDVLADFYWRNIGQGNFYLIMTVQTNYLTSFRIWCLKSAKNFKKNKFFKGTNHIASRENRFVTGENRSAAGEDRFVTGGNRSAAGEDRSASGEDRFVTGGNRSASGEDRSTAGEDRYLTMDNRFATCGSYCVTAGILCLSIIIIQYYQMKKNIQEENHEIHKKKHGKSFIWYQSYA